MKMILEFFTTDTVAVGTIECQFMKMSAFKSDSFLFLWISWCLFPVEEHLDNVGKYCSSDQQIWSTSHPRHLLEETCIPLMVRQKHTTATCLIQRKVNEAQL